MRTEIFDFYLPPECIATQPAMPRDSSRMLVVEQGALKDDITRHFACYLRPGDVVVMNNTKVIPARLRGRRGQAGIEVTLHQRINKERWRAFAKPVKRLSVNDNVLFSDNLSARVLGIYEEGEIELSFIGNNIDEELNLIGEMPLPPYMKRPAQQADKQSYQTVYAQREGAVAAPTAGLHFTEQLMQSVEESGAKIAFVTLHVGAGTFRPVKTEDTESHVMHSEYAELSAETAELLNQCRRQGGRIIAVGTTSLRVLESAADADGMLRPYSGETNIFITPGYRFKAVDMLLTNFHLPRSTLFMLVCAFCGISEMKNAYAYAITNQYRFYSYGDACLLYLMYYFP